MKRLRKIVIGAILVAVTQNLARAGDDGGAVWSDLTGPASTESWQRDNAGWTIAGNVALDPDNPRALVAEPGSGLLVMFLSDNGPELAEFPDTGPQQAPGAKEYYNTCGPGWAFAQNTPFRRYKTWMHEGGIATPMIARGPKQIEPNSMTRQVAHIIDFLPTFLELAGIEPTTTFESREVLAPEGRSLVPLFAGEASMAPRWLYWELQRARAVRHGDWKLVREARRHDWELYDLEADRTETNNLVAQFPERAQKMKQAWLQWSKEVGISVDSNDPSH